MAPNDSVLANICADGPCAAYRTSGSVPRCCRVTLTEVSMPPEASAPFGLPVSVAALGLQDGQLATDWRLNSAY